jgi:imidazolonepropionase-like amidohydrolase
LAATAITNAQVYNQETGEFSNQTVIIKEGKITSILSPSEEQSECNMIDANGLYLTPGFIDTCSQIGLKEIGIRWEGTDGYEPHEENGCHLQVIDGIYPFDKAFQDAAAAGVTAAHIVSAPEAVVGAKTAVIHTHGQTVDEMILKQHLGYSFSMGDVPKKAFWEKTNTPLTRMGIAQKIRVSLQALQSSNNLSEVPIFVRAHRADDIATAIRISEEFKLPFILVHATEYAMLPTRADDAPFSVIAGPCFQPMERGELKQLDPALYQTLFKHQIPFTFATDHPVSSINHLQMEGCLALKAGVPEKVILNGLTKDAAKLLQIDQLTGSIQVGLFADMVLWNRHPLDLMARAVRTFIKGKEVFRWE